MSYLPPRSSRSLFSVIFSSRWNRKWSDGLVSLQLLNWRTSSMWPLKHQLPLWPPSSDKSPEKGGTCMFLQEECCYYINESGLAENINTLHHLQENLRKKQNTGVLSLSWWHPMLTWLTPIITPIIVICLLLLMAPFLLRFLQTRMREIGQVAINQMLLHPFVWFSVEAPAT
ncbi:Endogenous retrovirus group FC1 Env polyprotein [Plecturocebus cupreus]